MKKNLLKFFIISLITANTGFFSYGQGTPEILHYRFNDTGKSVKNLASSPPSGSATATLNGALKQGSKGMCFGTALVGSGNTSNTDYMDTKWIPKLTGSWTISFWCKALDSSTTLYYLFSEINASSFRCFSGGVAGAGNILLRGPVTDVLITGGASKLPVINTFVYDSVAGYIYAYKNGSLNNSVAQSPITISGTANFLISGYNSLNGLNKDGLMDEFRFYKRALSAKEVGLLASSTKSYGSLTKQALCSFTSPSGKFTWNRSGTYSDTIPALAACDSVITIYLTITGNTTSTINTTVCDFLISPSKKYIWTKTGTYTDVIKNKSTGCDSIMTFNLTVKRSSTVNLKIDACNYYKSPSGKYTWTQTGQYADTIKNKIGCDSVMNINLSINHDQTSKLKVTTCEKYVSPSGKYTWTTSGTYTDIIPTTKGCDSTITVELTINYQITKNLTVKECDKYKSPSKKYTWTKSGTYNDTLKRKSGCDSILVINLTINYTMYTNIAPQSCGNYKSPSGRYTWNSTGNYMDTIQTQGGCDSIIGIDLKINPKSYANVTKTVCIEYMSPSGKYKWTKSGKYYDTIPNKKGCDSIITHNLTIINVNTDVSQSNNVLTSLANGAQYRWLNCNTNYSPIAGETGQTYTATELGSYAVEVKEYNCTDTSACFNVTKIGSVKNVSKNSIFIFPNPVNGLFTISAALPLENATIKIYSLSGKLIFIKENSFGNKNYIDISQFADGVYYLEISENGSLAHFKLLKQ